MHDIYSLGNVLLEVACSSSFVDRHGIGKSLWISEIVNNTGKDVVSHKLPTPENLKRQYIRLAKRRIPPLLGTNYCEVVISCLEGLPNEDGTAQDSALMSGSAYVEQVMGKLEKLNL